MKRSKYSLVTALLLLSYETVQAFSANNLLHASLMKKHECKTCSFLPAKTTSLNLYNDHKKVFSVPSNKKEDQFDLKEVRQLATTHHYKEIYFNRPSKVVVFSRKNRTKKNQYQDSSARITVYWTTGTVVTCMKHPKQGLTQLVRRNIDVKTLDSIFDNPRDQKGLGYPLNAKTSPDGSVFDVAALEEEAKAQLDWLNDEMNRMEMQRDQVETLIHDFEEKRHAEHLKSMEKLRDEKVQSSSIAQDTNMPLSAKNSGQRLRYEQVQSSSIPAQDTKRLAPAKNPMKIPSDEQVQSSSTIAAQDTNRFVPVKNPAKKTRDEILYKSSLSPPKRLVTYDDSVQVVRTLSHSTIKEHNFIENPFKLPVKERKPRTYENRNDHNTSIIQQKVAPTQPKPHNTPKVNNLALTQPKPLNTPIIGNQVPTQPQKLPNAPDVKKQEPAQPQTPHSTPEVKKQVLPQPQPQKVDNTSIFNNQGSTTQTQKSKVSSWNLSTPEDRRNRGIYISFCVHEAEKVRKYFNENVISLACGGKSSIFLYENGEWAFTPGLPDGLLHTLTMRQGESKMAPPTYVALGSRNRYFIKFEDGTSSCVGCDDMVNFLKLQKSARGVKSVAFGEDWDSYFVVFEDGGWKYNNIPYSLEILMKRIEHSIANRQELDKLDLVTLGGEGQYFVRAKTWSDIDYQYWFGGLTTQRVISDATLFKDRIQFVDFGYDGTYIMRYS